MSVIDEEFSSLRQLQVSPQWTSGGFSSHDVIGASIVVPLASSIILLLISRHISTMEQVPSRFKVRFSRLTGRRHLYGWMNVSINIIEGVNVLVKGRLIRNCKPLLN